MKLKSLSLILTIFFGLNTLMAQEPITNKKGSKYRFEVIKNLDATPVENQNRTGTCWSFSALSFFESELLRQGKGTVDLSEMYIVRNAYIGKAVNYLRMYGTFTFGPGGAFHDIPWVIKRDGIVPNSVYQGLNYGYKKHNHSEMNAVLTAMVKALAKKPQRGKLTPSWKKAFTEVVDAYLGDLPDDLHDFKFTVDGKEYNPYTYRDHLGLNMDDYVCLTSYNHHPFYKPFVLEVQDNWAMKSCYNLPLDELMEVMESAIMKGYTFAWGADISEKGFSSKNALAILPVDEETLEKDTKGTNAFMEPVEEKWVTQEERQEAFDLQETTDDHGMHATGILKDQNGKKYFIIKNSWGTKYNDCDGYFYASFPYVRYKTMNIMVHKDALSEKMKRRLGIK